MAKVELNITGVERTEFGKGPARRARRAGNVPAVLYGHGVDPIHLDIPAHDIFLIVKDSANAVVNVNYGKSQKLALVKSVQRHPVRRDILHVDLQVVIAGEKVDVEIPLILIGEAAPGTQIQQDEYTVLISVPATSIPESIELDVEGMSAGATIRVEDLPLPEGAEALVEADRILASVTAVQEIEAEMDEAAAGESADAGASEDASSNE